MFNTSVHSSMQWILPTKKQISSSKMFINVVITICCIFAITCCNTLLLVWEDTVHRWYLQRFAYAVPSTVLCKASRAPQNNIISSYHGYTPMPMSSLSTRLYLKRRTEALFSERTARYSVLHFSSFYLYRCVLEVRSDSHLTYKYLKANAIR